MKSVTLLIHWIIIFSFWLHRKHPCIWYIISDHPKNWTYFRLTLLGTESKDGILFLTSLSWKSIIIWMRGAAGKSMQMIPRRWLRSVLALRYSYSCGCTRRATALGCANKPAPLLKVRKIWPMLPVGAASRWLKTLCHFFSASESVGTCRG